MHQPRTLIVVPDDGAGAPRWQREIPFVIGVIGDFTGPAGGSPLSERHFIEIDVDTIDAVLAAFNTRLRFSVADTGAADGSLLAVTLRFATLADFAPDAVMRQVPVLLSFAADRAALRARLVASEDDPATADVTLASLYAAIDDIDRKLSDQMDAIIHDPAFRQLEGRWRGLAWLVRQVETSHHLRILVLSASRRDLARDLRAAAATDQTILFRKLHDAVFGAPEKMPFAVLIGDYEWDASDIDATILQSLGTIAEAARAPFVSGVSPAMFGCRDWDAVARLTDLAAAHASVMSREWQNLRDDPTSRLISLVLPRLLARPRYGLFDNHVAAFAYVEGADGPPWISAAYAVGATIGDAFRRHGNAAMMLDSPQAGVVHALPCTESDVGTLIGPIDYGISEPQALTLRLLGLLPLHRVGAIDAAAFFETTTLHRVSPGTDPAIARLPCQLAIGRFAHYLKRMAHDAANASAIVPALATWIAGYVLDENDLDLETALNHPLRAARIAIEDGWIVAWLRPRMAATSVRVKICPAPGNER